MIWKVTRCIGNYKRLSLILGSVLLVYSWIYILPNKLSDIEIRPCKIEKLDPWDESLKPYLVDPPPLKCSNRQQLMFVDSKGNLQFNNTVMRIYKLDKTSLNCSYSIMKREDGDAEVTFKPEVKFVVPVFVKSHVFRVKCLNSTKIVLYDYLHFNPFWNEDAKHSDDIENETQEKLSVIIFGIDSVSRSHALRNLPKSYKFLLDELNAYDFEGYSKVGENTWPNLVPLLTGQSHRNFPLVQHLRKHVDSMPLIWNEKVVQHFATFFAEDRPDISTFNFVKSGFKYVPTDYFFRPYTLGMHKFEPKIIDYLGNPSWDCYGVKNYFDIQIEYLKGFLNRYINKRKYVYFWNNQVCHEQFTTLSRGDESLLDFLKWMKYTNQTKNAIFVVISDHGYRIGGASLTHVGRAENNKPWLMIHVPKFLKEKYKWLHTTLSENTLKLSTHYDMYQTMLDLIQDVAFSEQKTKPVKTELVRRNLFHNIPLERTCADAGIEEKYCTCKEKVNISTTSDVVLSMAKFLVKGINDILSKNEDVCCTLSLHNVTEASVSYSNSDQDNTPNGQTNPGFFHQLFFRKKQDITGRYYILFHTIPGFAYFEGTVDFSEFGPEGVPNEMTMIGEPSRLDRYGNQSQCVQDSFLRLFCYCKNYKPET
ncbi:uncharacterized protein LOC123523936 [Mercenaria mercenaria]|uniref:uncharacterized protein LOC123523936 n=1 Tax=Mercenaria mercenaria TaxID=6596 RepID=UPI00234E55F3|nr:uncharacterized protein LOC123523936 [Mercenaria mercenaria]